MLHNTRETLIRFKMSVTDMHDFLDFARQARLSFLNNLGAKNVQSTGGSNVLELWRTSLNVRLISYTFYGNLAAAFSDADSYSRLAKASGLGQMYQNISRADGRLTSTFFQSAIRTFNWRRTCLAFGWNAAALRTCNFHVT